MFLEVSKMRRNKTGFKTGNKQSTNHLAAIILFISLFCLTGLRHAPAETGKQNQSEAAKSTVRIIHFPKDRPLGRLMVTDSNLIGQIRDFEWEYFAQAAGSVQIPPGKEVWLQVSTATAWQDLSPLSSLRPSDLYRLSIYGSYGRGPKPDDRCMQHLGALKKLKALDLMFTDVTGKGLKAIHGFQSLERLMLPEKIGDADMAQLAKLKSLKALYCGGKEVTDAGLAHLAELPLLEDLVLAGVHMSDNGLVHIARLGRLKTLELVGNFTDAGLSHLRGVTSLKNLYLAKSPSITDAGLAHLSHIPTLEMVNLSGNRNITDKGIAYLKKLPALKNLSVNRCKLTDEAVSHLSHVKTLESLNLPSHDISDRGLADIATFPKLRELHVGGDISDAGIAHLAKLTNLEELEIDGKDITDEGIRQLSRLPNLTKLNLNGCPGLTSEGIRQIAKLPNLTDLVLSCGPNIGDDALSQMTKMKGLKKLRLGLAETNMTLSSLTRLNDLPNLTKLNVPDVNRGDNNLDVAGLPKLEELVITLRKKQVFTDKDLDCLANLKELKNLQLNPHEFTDSGVAKLAGLTNMETLFIGGPDITDKALSYLSNMKQLKRLRISHGDITDTGIKYLKSAEMLGLLEITSNCDSSPAAMDRLRNTVPNLRVYKNWQIRQIPRVADTAPDFKLTTINGKTIELADFKGKVVLLYFWATWCRPCVVRTPTLKSFYEDMSQYKDFEMISISQDDAEYLARKHIEQHNLTWPQVCVGLNSKVAADYGTNSHAPFYFLIDPNGKIVSTTGNLNTLAQKIETILGPHRHKSRRLPP